MTKKQLLKTLIGFLSAGVTMANTVDIYAHRGFRALAPENTLPAYTEALRIGVDALDMDINMTKDHILVVTHDFTLNPELTKNKSGKWIKKAIPIKDLTLSELKSYTVGEIKPNSSLARLYPHHQDMKNVHIPTLVEVINFVKQSVGDRVKLQIEIKTDPYQPKLSYSAKEMANALYQVLRQTGMTHNVEVQAFEWQALVDLHKLNPAIKTAYLTDHTTDPMNPSQDSHPSAQNLWTFPLKPADFNYDYPKMVKHLGGTLWEPFEIDLSHETLQKAYSLGLKVVTWSWSEAEGSDFNYPVINQLIQWNVDGIITDRPDILRGLEAANGLDLPTAYPDTPYAEND